MPAAAFATVIATSRARCRYRREVLHRHAATIATTVSMKTADRNMVRALTICRSLSTGRSFARVHHPLQLHPHPRPHPRPRLRLLPLYPHLCRLPPPTLVRPATRARTPSLRQRRPPPRPRNPVRNPATQVSPQVLHPRCTTSPSSNG